MPNPTQGAPEHADVIRIGDKPAIVIGNDVKAGEPAPRFVASANNWAPVDVACENRGRVVIIAAVPSLDPPTCDMETRRFNHEAANLGDDIRVYVVSTDFPMALDRQQSGNDMPRRSRGISFPISFLG